MCCPNVLPKCVAQMLWIQSTWAVDVECHVDMLSLQSLLIFAILKRNRFLAALLGSTFGSSFGCTFVCLFSHLWRRFWQHFLAALFGSTFWQHFHAALFGSTFWRHFLAALLAAHFGSTFWQHISAALWQQFSTTLFSSSFWQHNGAALCAVVWLALRIRRHRLPVRAFNLKKTIDDRTPAMSLFCMCSSKHVP